MRLRISTTQYERAQALRTQELISDDELETAEQSYTNAEGQMLRAEAAVQLANERLADARVIAPISGTIISKQVEEGTVITSSMSNVSGGTALVQMANLAELEIRTLVDELDIFKVRPGLPIESTVEALPELTFRGTVIKIEPQAVLQQSITTFPVLSRIDNSSGLLLPGINADVEIKIAERKQVLTLSNQVIRPPDEALEIVDILGLDPPVPQPSAEQDGDERESTGPARLDRATLAASPTRVEAVFVPGDDGRPALHWIVTGLRDWQRTEVLSGLADGDEVILVPSPGLLEAQESLRERFGRSSPFQLDRRGRRR